MIRTSSGALFTLIAAIVVGGLGWVCGWVSAGLCLAVPFLWQRESPELFAGGLVFAALTSAGLAFAASEVLAELARAADRTRWRRRAALWYLAAAAASAATLLIQHYSHLAQYAG